MSSGLYQAPVGRSPLPQQFSAAPAPLLLVSRQPPTLPDGHRSQMPTCPIRTDLIEAASSLKTTLYRIRQESEFCARCPSNPCHGRLCFNDLVAQAASQAFQDLRYAPTP